MSFNILAIRSGQSEDDLHYPVPGEAPDSVELTEDDGDAARFQAVELNVAEMTSGGPKGLIGVTKMKAAVIITDARLAVACSKYEKGGGWTPFSIGAIPVAIAANTVSKVRTARSRRGKMLVGHVPYDYLTSVGFRPPSGLKGRGRLALPSYDPSMDGYRGLVLDLTPASGADTAMLSRRIAKSAAGYQFEREADRLEPERRAMPEALREPEPLTPKDTAFSSHRLVPNGFVPSGQR